MATSVLPRRRNASTRSRSRKKSRSRHIFSWLAWWPLLLAMVATPFTIKAAEILPLTGPPGLLRLRLLYPFPMLAQHFGGASEDLRASLSQVLMYAQFPVYALLLMGMRRVRSLSAGFGVALALHLLAFAALWLLPAI